MSRETRTERFEITSVDVSFDGNDAPSLHCSLFKGEVPLRFAFEAWDRPPNFRIEGRAPTHPTRMLHVEFGDQNWGYQDAVEAVETRDHDLIVRFRCDPPPWVARTFELNFSMVSRSVSYVVSVMTFMCDRTGVPFIQKDARA